MLPRIVLVLLCGIGQAYAADVSDEASADDEKPGVLSGVGTMVDETHDKVSGQFSSFVVQVDDFIGSGESKENLNNSWARIRLDTIKPGGEKLKLAARVKLKIVLPQSQQRFRVLLSTEDDESSSSNSDAAQREQVASEDNNGFALALRFVRTAQEKFRLNYDIGARYRDDRAQLFGRLNIAYKKDSAWGFTNRISNNFTYYSSSGYENSFTIESHRLFFDRESLYFRNSLNVSWAKGLRGAGIGETVGFYADIDKRRALAFEGITGLVTALNGDATDRYLGVEFRVRFRHSVWRPWFYYEFWPSVSWSSSNDYKKAYGGMVRLEVTLGGF